MRDDEALGFTLIGEPSDPVDLCLIPVMTARRTPTRRWQSGVVMTWSELSRFFDSSGAPRSP
jgi:hypothetical protein